MTRGAHIGLDAGQLTRLSDMMTPTLDCPMTVTNTIAMSFQYGDTTIDGLTSTRFRRDPRSPP